MACFAEGQQYKNLTTELLQMCNELPNPKFGMITVLVIVILHKFMV